MHAVVFKSSDGIRTASGSIVSETSTDIVMKTVTGDLLQIRRDDIVVVDRRN